MDQIDLFNDEQKILWKQLYKNVNINECNSLTSHNSKLVDFLVWFGFISTIIGYLMPYPVFTYILNI